MDHPAASADDAATGTGSGPGTGARAGDGAEKGRRRPPTAVMKLINRIPAALLRSPLHGPLSKRLMLLTFRGRRSGRRITIPVGYFRVDDRTVLLATERPWQKNLAGGAQVELRLRGRDVAGRSEVIADEGAFAEALAAMLAIDPGYGRFFGVAVGADGRPDAGQVRAAFGRGLRIVRVTLDGSPPA